MCKQRLALVIVLLLALFAFSVPRAQAASVAPVFVSDNPRCTDLGYSYGFKIDPPNAGTYSIDGTNTVTVTTTDGVYFDWTSSLGMDAVIVKGGPNANLYVYDPPAESFGDTGLHSPINDDNGKPYGLSHIEFCYDYEVVVQKTATTTYTRTWQWSIDKSVNPDEWALFRGDSGTSEYTVAVTRTGYVDSGWTVSGSITITNPAPMAAVITGVADVVSAAIGATVDCGVTFPYQLAAKSSLTCTYSAALPDASARTNTATVTTSGEVGGGSGSAAVTFGEPTTVVNGTIHVDDTNGGSWLFSNSGSVTYSRTFACDADEGTHSNTATIRETGQSDSASVDVSCYALAVSKDAATSLKRTWDWNLEKVGSHSELTLSAGQMFQVTYDVTVDASDTDSDWAVAGAITVTNPAPMAAVIKGVADVVSPAIGATVDCGVTFPYELAADSSLTCTYSAALPDASARTNTATATQQNYAYDHLLKATPVGTTDYSGTAEVSFTAPTVTEIDECIEVEDTFAGTLGTVCVGDALKTFTYNRWIGPYPECGSYTVGNTASFATNDTGSEGEDSWSIDVNVPCEGCTLTPGYWKTHSEYGPAPYDDTWALLADGADTVFYQSGKSWYQVLWTPPAGNAYYNLSFQYIAARMNLLNGAASTSEVDAGLAWANTFFSTHEPDDKLPKPERAEVIATASLLDRYNNGLVGPGHCDF